MFKFLAPPLFALALAAAPASAATVSFVSSKGTDTGTCADAATPCRLFSYTLGQTSPGGEIKVLDAGNYGPLVINKSITITGVDGAGIVSGAPTLISVNPGSTGVVNLTNLTLDGVRRTAVNGIVVVGGTAVSIKNCTVRNVSARGVSIEPPVDRNLVFSIEDTVVSGVGTSGIHLEPGFNPGNNGSIRGSINRVTISRASDGIFIGNATVANITSSMIFNNTDHGVRQASLAESFQINDTTITRSRIGLAVGGGTASSAGNNFIINNGTNVSGTLTNVGMQ